MAVITRRRLLRRTALAAAAGFCGCPNPAWTRLQAGATASPQSEPAVDPAAIRTFASKIRGQVISPGEVKYEAARQIFNSAFDRRPAVIVRCADAPDVARALDFAQRFNFIIAVRSGGHSRLGYGMCDGGVVIDLSTMKNVEVDGGRRVARAEAGALVRDLDEATQGFGLATTSGGCPTVGIAGLTLGGGEGRLMDKYGLACDNLLSARLVTVDGKQMELSENSNPDLFWAVRGGGGNFGVLTALEYRLHPIGQVLSGALTYPAGRIPELVRAFVSFLDGAPDEMDAFLQLLPSEEGPRVKIDVCYCGELKTGVDLVKPLRALKPQSDTLNRVSYLEAQQAGGFLQTPVAHFQTNLFLLELGDAALAAITAALENAPTKGKVIIVALRGAVSRVRSRDTAFALRQPGYEIDIAAVWSLPSEKANAMRWVESTRDQLQPFAHGVYVNQLGDTSDQLVRAAYGSNYSRLVEIKKRYDPNNVLRLNQNIQPG